eukprot:2101443-Pleurochrysis_carterae.AAC.1
MPLRWVGRVRCRLGVLDRPPPGAARRRSRRRPAVAAALVGVARPRAVSRVGARPRPPGTGSAPPLCARGRGLSACARRRPQTPTLAAERAAWERRPPSAPRHPGGGIGLVRLAAGCGLARAAGGWPLVALAEE